MNWTEEQLNAYLAKRNAAFKGAMADDVMFRQRSNKGKPDRNAPNKTELRFEQEILMPSLPADATYGFQRMTFLLAPGLRYTPDWIAWQESDFSYEHGWLTCYEVKGSHVWDDARVKFLTARELFPWITWQAWQWKGGEWREIWTA